MMEQTIAFFSGAIILGGAGVAATILYYTKKVIPELKKETQLNKDKNALLSEKLADCTRQLSECETKLQE